MVATKNDNEAIELATSGDVRESVSNTKGPVMRSKSDDLSVWQSARRFKLVSGIAMCAAFCASLDGYRNDPRYLDMKSGKTNWHVQKSTSMVELCQTRGSSGSSRRKERRSSRGNIYQRGEGFNRPVKPSVKLYYPLCPSHKSLQLLIFDDSSCNMPLKHMVVKSPYISFGLTWLL